MHTPELECQLQDDGREDMRANKNDPRFAPDPKASLCQQSNLPAGQHGVMLKSI